MIMAGNSDVDRALKLLMGDFIRKKPYIMMSEKPDKGDVVIQRFRTITDARRYANVNGIEDYSLWSELKLKRKTIRKKLTTSEKEIDEEEEDLEEDDLEEDDLEEDDLEEDDETEDDLV